MILSEIVGAWTHILFPPSFGSAYNPGKEGELLDSQLSNNNEGWAVKSSLPFEVIFLGAILGGTWLLDCL